MRTLLLLIVLALSPLVARADQITVGTYGFGYNNQPTMSLHFAGARFSVNAFANTLSGVSLPAFYDCYPCASGTTVSLNSSAFLSWADWGFGSFMSVNGVSYPAYQGVGMGANSSMSFLAGDVLLPPTTESTITISTPFTLQSGGISGIGYSVRFNYSGGMADVTYRRTGTDALGRTTYSFNNLVYTFQAQPTPEPMTIVLLGSGLFALGLRLRKRK